MPPPRRVRVPHEVAALVRGLHPVLKRKVRAALQEILDHPYAGKALRNELQGLRSYRVGRFRIIYRLRRDVELVAFGPRDSIYVETYRQLHEPRGRYRTRPSSDSRTRRHATPWSDRTRTAPRVRTLGVPCGSLARCFPRVPEPAFTDSARNGAVGGSPQSAASSYASGGGQAQARWRSP